MNLKTFRTVVQGVGAAILLMISQLAALISPYHALLYHSILPMRSLVWGTLIDLAALSLLAALLVSYLEKKQTGLRALVWVLVAARVAYTIVEHPFAHLGWNIPDLTPTTAFVITLVGALALWWLRPPAYRAAVRGLLVLLLILGCNAVWMVPELVHQGLQGQQTDALMPLV